MDPTDLDNEHAIILDALKVVRNCHERNLVDVGLDRTLHYACAHFAHEESLMSVLEAEDRMRHCHEHEELCLRLAEMKTLNLRGDQLREGLVAALEKWLHEHISSHDALLVRKLAEHDATKVSHVL